MDSASCFQTHQQPGNCVVIVVLIFMTFPECDFYGFINIDYGHKIMTIEIAYNYKLSQITAQTTRNEQRYK